MAVSGFSIHLESGRETVWAAGCDLYSLSYGVAAFFASPGAGTLTPPCIAI